MYESGSEDESGNESEDDWGEEGRRQAGRLYAAGYVSHRQTFFKIKELVKRRELRRLDADEFIEHFEGLYGVDTKLLRIRRHLRKYFKQLLIDFRVKEMEAAAIAAELMAEEELTKKKKRKKKKKKPVKVVVEPLNEGDDIHTPEVEEEEKEVPHDLTCPITTTLFVDPVVAADGNSYERNAIMSWIEKRATSPLTGEDLDHTLLIPNKALKRLVVAWGEGSL